MLKASAETIAEVTGGRVVAGEDTAAAVGVAIDSRAVEPGQAFVALAGERSDGHGFLRDAAERGARVLIVSRARADSVDVLEAVGGRDIAVVAVDDGVAAVQALAAWHRARLRAVVVGITGSTGKTTTKDLLVSSLSASLRVVATRGNRNNELGLPLTVLEAGDDAEVLVLEMGMRGLGQIAALAAIAKPDVGLVTNVGTSHIELLGTQSAVATAKGELVRAVGEGGAVFLNGDDAYSDALALDALAPVTLYGLSERCAVRAEEIALDSEGRASFALVYPYGAFAVRLPMPGRHNVYNALAAGSVALHLGVAEDAVAEGLASAAVSSMRMETFATASGITVINDAYNASPASMKAALETLAALAVRGRRVAVLGDMAELGSLSELAHFELGETVARLGVDVVVTVGDRARRVADGARAEGMAAEYVRVCSSPEDAIEVLDEVLESGDAVLVKASRVMGLERVVEGVVSSSVR